MKMTMMPFSTTGKSSVAWIKRNLMTMSLWTVTWRPAVEEVCKSHVGAMLFEGAEEEGEDTDPEVVPNFAKAHEALMKVKSFV
jgi:hypothetical protein